MVNHTVVCKRVPSCRFRSHIPSHLDEAARSNYETGLPLEMRFSVAE